MMMCSDDVQVVESSLVSPSQETPTGQLWLNPLDLLLVNRGHTPTVYFYRPAAGSAAADFFDVARLKESMARALVDFYPLAGRLAVDADGRFVIDCNAEGALLVVARSDLTVDDFGDVTPSPELKELFVPRVQQPSIMLAIQVTFLKCGGVAFGTALHHAAADAISSFRFFHAWSALCSGRDDVVGAMAETELPCHDRALLRARSPPFVNPDAFAVFCPKLTLTQPSGPVASKVFTVSKDHVAALKQACGGVSTFCALSAHAWRCVCAARGLPADATTRLTLPANIRRRMKPPLPDSYFGNALIWVGTSAVVRDVTTEALADTAARISGAVRRMDDEVVRSAIDYCELAEKNGKPIPGSLPETELRVISWLGMPVYDADYGWGKPQLMVRAESERSGFVYLMNDGGGCVQVVVCAEAACLKEFEKLLFAKTMWP
ncbi:shikimate O-hydroxycinnamoyltransferase-like [Panicum miliaceum]|uniref:Shikimate O-hydroxycinnamoyltransferase-like n=1 Tax=Panicum miliaceum TaxID=4540 RepID=A0A3L6T2U9_PANMI|nr:shikimate O-hydroxycinnamoyltransferase-like [Panicum miliaceum]